MTKEQMKDFKEADKFALDMMKLIADREPTPEQMFYFLSQLDDYLCYADPFWYQTSRKTWVETVEPLRKKQFEQQTNH